MIKNWYANLSTTLRWLLAILAILVLFSFAASYWIKHRIIMAVGQEQTNIGKITYDNLYVSLLSGTIQFSNLRWETTLNNPFPTNLNSGLTATAEKAAMDGISWSQIIFSKNLIVEDFYVERPRFEIRPTNQLVATDTTSIDSQEEAKLVAAKLKNISITNGAYTVFGKNNDTLAAFALDSLHLGVTDFELKAPGDTINYTINNLELGGQNLHLMTGDGLYIFKISNLYKQADAEVFNIENFQLQPRYSKEAFFQRLDKRQGRLDIKIPKIELSNIDIKELLRRKRFLVDEVLIQSPHVQIYTDKNVPKDETENKPLPNKLLRELATDLNIRKLAVKNAHVEFEQKEVGRKETGYIDFEEVYASIYNITNDSASLVKDHFTMANIIGKFMGSGDLALDLQFDLNDPANAFTYECRLGKFDMQEVNEMLVQAALIKLESGKIENLVARATVNRQKAQGEITFDYRNLDFKLLDEQYRPNRKLLTGLAKMLTMPDNNLPHQDSYRMGRIYYEKVPADSFFRYLWRSVFSGLRSVMIPDLFLRDELEKKDLKKQPQ